MTQSSHQDWFRLDNVAKIYPVVKSYLVSNVFRITATMDVDVDPGLLKQAVLDCRNRFPSFYVKLRKGFFWYYYEPNDKEPLVVPESSYVCDPIDAYKNNWFYFVFFYYKNRISLEIFHGLTDGKGALEFLKTVLFRYLELSGLSLRSEGMVLVPDEKPQPEELEDSYLENFSRSGSIKSDLRRSYRMRGTLFPQGGAGVNIGKVRTERLLSAAKKHDATVGQYLAAVYILSIIMTADKRKILRKPVNLTIPIDMRKYYDSKTLRNFFLVFRLSVQKTAGEEPDLEKILEITKGKFASELTPERLQSVLNSNVAIEKNIAARFVPLGLKYVLIKLSNFMNGSTISTTNMSNLGRVDLPSSMQDHVKGFDVTFVLGRRSTHNLAVMSYSGDTSISLTRRVVEDELDNTFFGLLEADGVVIERSGNNWEKYTRDVDPDILDTGDPGDFPPYERQKRRDRRLAKLSAALGALLIVLSVAANIFLWNANLWSVIAASVILYIWVLGLLTLKKTLHVGLKMMLHAISLSVLLVIINAFAYKAETLHRVTWALSFGIPGILAGFIIAINITMISHRQYRRNFFLYQISLSIIGLIPLVLVLSGLAEPVWPSITTAACSYITIMGLFVFAKKIILSEFKKKFHF